MVATAKLTTKGQLTMPKAVRDRLGLRAGDQVAFEEVEGGFRVSKRVRRSPFDAYVGYLSDQQGQDPDALVDDMREHS